MSKKLMTLSIDLNESLLLIIKNKKIIFSQTFGFGKSGSGLTDVIRKISEGYKGKKYPLVMTLPDEKCIYKTVSDIKEIPKEFYEFVKEDRDEYLYEYMRTGSPRRNKYLAVAVEKSDVEEIKYAVNLSGFRLIKLIPQTVVLSELLKQKSVAGKIAVADFSKEKTVLRFFEACECKARYEIYKESKGICAHLEEVKRAFDYYEEKGFTEVNTPVYITGPAMYGLEEIKLFREVVKRECKSIKALLGIDMSLREAAFAAYETGALLI